MKLYVVWGSRDLEQRIQHATLVEDAEGLNRVSQAVSQATEFWQAWALAIGGEVVWLDGTKGMVKVPADKLDEMAEIRGKYANRVGVSIAVGVGMKPSEAMRSYEVGELEGGKIRLYTAEVDQILEDAEHKPQDSVDRLAEEYIKSEPEMLLFLSEDLQAIAHLEQNLRKNLDYTPRTPFDAPIGPVNMKPSTAHDEYVHNVSLQKSFPGLMDKKTFLHELKRNNSFYAACASSHWNRLKTFTKGSLAKSAFAWRWGRGALEQAEPETVKHDSYVNSFLTMRAILEKRENEFNPDDYLPHALLKVDSAGPELLTAKSPTQGPSQPALSGGTGAGMAGAKRPAAAAKPKGEGSEHSDGEAARAAAAEDPKMETTHAAKDFQDQLNEMSEDSEDEDGAGAQSVEDTESGDQIRQQVIQVLSQFRQFSPYMEQIKQENPDLYQAFMQVVQTMLGMARELIALEEGKTAEDIKEPETEDETNPEGSPTEEKSASGETNPETKGETKKEEMAMGKASLPMPHASAHHNVVLPVGSYKEGDGHIKVAHGDGKTGWVEARAGQVLSQDGHPISALNPGGR